MVDSRREAIAEQRRHGDIQREKLVEVERVKAHGENVDPLDAFDNLTASAGHHVADAEGLREYLLLHARALEAPAGAALHAAPSINGSARVSASASLRE